MLIVAVIITVIDCLVSSAKFSIYSFGEKVVEWKIKSM